MRAPGVSLLLALAAAAPSALPAPVPNFNEKNAQAVLKQSCLACHRGKSAAAKFDVAPFIGGQAITSEPRKWTRALTRVRNGEMPPVNAPPMDTKVREEFVNWLDYSLRVAACSDGIAPAQPLMRRLNRNEYSATTRDLLNIHVNAAHALPADGAGGEGFDNAAETLFLSPMHAEKYLEAARQALIYGLKDPRSRSRFMIAEPKDGVTPEQAARKILDAFVPRAFRRPAPPAEIDQYYTLFLNAHKEGDPFDDAMHFALQGVLMSPHFLFRLEEPNPGPEPRLADQYAMASRLSYFLWGSTPDDTLLDLAAKGKLQDEATLKEQVVRMLKDLKSREFAEHFVEQWLGTRELGRDIKPDEKLFPEYYDAEITAAIRYEPILFFQEVLAQNLPLTTLLDSDWTILNNKSVQHYKITVKERLRQQPVRATLPPNSHRGGLLTMSAILAVSSMPHRTSPVLRGKWILESILGTPPPPPPPNVPELKDAHDAAAPQTVRERLEAHRQNPVCASCHSRIDPLGFGLENYDVLGRWRETDGGKPIDAKGELPDGTAFNGAEELKKVLLERKDLMVKNLTTKLLGWALGRGLMLEDYCAVDQIVEEVKKNNYSAHALVHGVVLSVPFRYQAGTKPGMPVTQIPAAEPAAVASKEKTQ
jgi:mono/diheme cytochrome c family protein